MLPLYLDNNTGTLSKSRRAFIYAAKTRLRHRFRGAPVWIGTKGAREISGYTGNGGSVISAGRPTSLPLVILTLPQKEKNPVAGQPTLNNDKETLRFTQGDMLG